MSEISSSSTGSRAFKTAEVVLGATGAIVCISVAALFAMNQNSSPGDLFPFPGLYLLEIAIVGILGFNSIFKRDNRTSWRLIPWIVSGILLAFIILGAWTVGLFLIPAGIAFFLAALLGDLRIGQRVSRGILWFFNAGLLQALFILLMVAVDIS